MKIFEKHTEDQFAATPASKVNTEGLPLNRLDLAVLADKGVFGAEAHHDVAQLQEMRTAYGQQYGQRWGVVRAEYQGITAVTLHTAFGQLTVPVGSGEAASITESLLQSIDNKLARLERVMLDTAANIEVEATTGGNVGLREQLFSLCLPEQAAFLQRLAKGFGVAADGDSDVSRSIIEPDEPSANAWAQQAAPRIGGGLASASLRRMQQEQEGGPQRA